MLLLLFIAGLATFGCTQEQDICNYDPDIIFFENAHLEKLKESILSGKCSQPSFGWKMELNNALRSYLGSDREVEYLSDRDQETLNSLSRFNDDSEDGDGSIVIFPDEAKRSREESERKRSTYQLVQTPSEDSHRFSRNDQRYRPLAIPKRTYTERKMKREINKPILFTPNLNIERQPKLFETNNKRLQNNVLSSNSQNQENKNNLSLLKNQRTPQTDDQSEPNRPSIDDFSKFPEKTTTQRTHENLRLFVPNIENKVNDFEPEKGFFRHSDKRRPPFYPSGWRWQSRRPDLFRPNEVTSSTTEQNSFENQRLPNHQRNSPNQRLPPVLQKPQTTTPSAVESTTLPGPPTWPTAPSLCVRMCSNTKEYNPVCGSDRVTYNNPGRLHCEQLCGKENVTLNHYGTCVRGATTVL